MRQTARCQKRQRAVIYVSNNVEKNAEKCQKYLKSEKGCDKIKLIFQTECKIVKEIASTKDFQQRIKRVLVTEAEIADAVKKAGKQIDALYDGRPILLVSLLKGAFVFMADLCRAVSVPAEIGFMCAKSYYKGTRSSGIVQITMDLEQDISGYHVVLVEDIIDTGRTLNDVVKLLRARNPLSLHVVTLLDKPSRRVVDFEADITLFTIPDHFVIGYGLDCGEYYHNLPYIAEYDEEEVNNA